MSHDPISLLMNSNIHLLPDFLGGNATARIAPVNKQVKKEVDRNLNKLKDKLLSALNETQIDLKECEKLNVHEIKRIVQDSIWKHFGIFRHLLPQNKEEANAIEKVIECKDAVVKKINERLFKFFDKLALKWPEAEAFNKEVHNLKPLERAKKIHDWLKENGPKLVFTVINDAFIDDLGERENIPLEIFYLNLSSDILNNGLIRQMNIDIDGPLIEMLFKTGKYHLINSKIHLGHLCAWLLHCSARTASKVIPISVIKECYLGRNAQDLTPNSLVFDDFKKEQIEEIFQHLCDNIDKPDYVLGVMSILSSSSIKKKGCDLKCSPQVHEAIYRQALISNAWSHLPASFAVKKYLENSKLFGLSHEILKDRSAEDIQVIFDEACQVIFDQAGQKLPNLTAIELVEDILSKHFDKISTSQLMGKLCQQFGFNARVAKTALIGVGTFSTMALLDIVRGKYKGAAVTAVGGMCWLTLLAKTKLKFPEYRLLKSFSKGFLNKGWKAFST